MTPTTKLDVLDNSFDKENWAQCFNHTLQLSAKSLLKPLNTTLSGKAADDDHTAMYQNDISQTILKDDKGDGDGNGDKNEDEDISVDLQDDDIDKLQELNKEDWEHILEETAAVHTTVTKVRFVKQRILAFSPTNYLNVYRSGNYHLLSFIQQISLSLPGDTSAVSSISRNDSFPMML